MKDKYDQFEIHQHDYQRIAYRCDYHIRLSTLQQSLIEFLNQDNSAPFLVKFSRYINNRDIHIRIIINFI